MNNRDPFDLRRKHTLGVLRASAIYAGSSAVSISRHAIESSKTAFESGRQALEHSGVLPEGMAFNLPNNVPSFTDPQRRLEDHAWSAAQPRNGAVGSGIDKIGGFFSNKADLPMYKDKPYTYAASRRQKTIFQKKRFVFGIIAVFLGLVYWLAGGWQAQVPAEKKFQKSSIKQSTWWKGFAGNQGAVDWAARRERVREAFILSWDAYERDAWGRWLPYISIDIQRTSC
jgi:endoplasmic reticulum Man9GlcNAc2 1,2-alpha-mannosidase